ARHLAVKDVVEEQLRHHRRHHHIDLTAGKMDQHALQFADLVVYIESHSRGILSVRSAFRNREMVPHVPMRALDTLWFQVAGTICNITCTHCFISCSPKNHSHEMLSLAD